MVVLVAAAIVVGVFAAGVACWALAILKLAAGLPLVSWRKRRPVPWALMDLAAAIALYVLAMIVLGVALRQLGWLPDTLDEEKMTLAQRKVLVWANVGASALLLAIALPLIAWRSGATWRDLGWSWNTWFEDVRLGMIGFCMLAPPVYLVQAVLVQFWPSKHPLMEMFRGTPDPWFFGVLFLAAVLVAPLFEEIVFRVLLQGFLEKVFTFRGSLGELFFSIVPPASVPQVSGHAVPVPLAPAATSQPIVASLTPIEPSPYASPFLVADLAPQAAIFPRPDDPQPRLVGWIAWLPIALASLVFALLHGWPDQIPLVMLAAGMGYLYQRTHSVVPSIVVHMLLNGLSMIGLWVQVYEMPEEVTGHLSLVICGFK